MPIAPIHGGGPSHSAGTPEATAQTGQQRGEETLRNRGFSPEWAKELFNVRIGFAQHPRPEMRGKFKHCRPLTSTELQQTENPTVVHEVLAQIKGGALVANVTVNSPTGGAEDVTTMMTKQEYDHLHKINADYQARRNATFPMRTGLGRQ